MTIHSDLPGWAGSEQLEPDDVTPSAPSEPSRAESSPASTSEPRPLEDDDDPRPRGWLGRLKLPRLNNDTLTVDPTATRAGLEQATGAAFSHFGRWQRRTREVPRAAQLAGIDHDAWRVSDDERQAFAAPASRVLLALLPAPTMAAIGPYLGVVGDVVTASDVVGDFTGRSMLTEDQLRAMIQQEISRGGFVPPGVDPGAIAPPAATPAVVEEHPVGEHTPGALAAELGLEGL